MTFWIRVTQRTLPLVVYSVAFYDLIIDTAASCTLAWAWWGHWQSLLKVLMSKVMEPKSQPVPTALTNTLMVNKLEITLSLPLVELVHLLSSYCKLTGLTAGIPSRVPPLECEQFTLISGILTFVKTLWLGITASQVLITLLKKMENTVFRDMWHSHITSLWHLPV